MTHITLSILFCQACQLQLLLTQRNIDGWLWWAFIARSGHRYLEPIPVRPRTSTLLIDRVVSRRHWRQSFTPDLRAQVLFSLGFFPRFFFLATYRHTLASLLAYLARPSKAANLTAAEMIPASVCPNWYVRVETAYPALTAGIPRKSWGHRFKELFKKPVFARKFACNF